MRRKMSLATVEKDGEETRSPSPEYRTQEEYNQAVVYSNDNIMETILSHVYNFQDRMRMKRVSYRFQKLLDRSGILAPSAEYGELSLLIPTYGARIWMSLGSYHKTFPLLASTKPGEEKRQHDELMTALQKLLFAKDIVQSVVLGGSANDYYYTGDSTCESLTITRDLFQYLENFANLKSLQLDDSYIMEQATDYVISDECKFKYQLESFHLLGMTQNSWILSLMQKKLRNLSIRRINLDRAEAVLKRLEELNLHLDKMDLEVSNVSNIENAREIFSKLTSRCKVLHLTISTFDYHPDPNLLPFARNIDLWTNITSLTLCSRSHSIRHAVDMSVIFENISYLRKLESLTISENVKASLLVFLTKGVRDLKNLKYLKFSDRSKKKEYGILKDFLSSLPLTLEEIKFDGLMWEADALNAFCDRFSSSLKSLTVTRPRNSSSSKLFTSFAQRLTNLSTLHFDYSVPWQLIHYVIENPNINEININTSNNCPMKAEIVLQDNFEVYRKNRFDDSWSVVCSGRKKTSTLKLPMYPVPLISRKPRVEKEKW